MATPEIGVALVAGQLAPQDEAGTAARATIGAVVRGRWSPRLGVEGAVGWSRDGLDPRVEVVTWIGDPSADVVARFAGGLGLAVPTNATAATPFLDAGAGVDAALLPILDARLDGRVRVDTRGEAALVFLVGVGLHVPRAYDADGDGVSDRLDLCLSVPEDLDAFEDTDGCPDLDDDGDQLADTADRCPRIPEDRDAFLDADGCPEPDNDGDGLDDRFDACPNVAEDPDGYEDADGCADLDDDRDAVPDDDDACPRVPEDADGFEDTDGCPDPDNDGDGVGDRFDGAPMAPETRNGWQDGDGVPDELPPLLSRFTGPQPRVRFDGNALTERGEDAADTLADVLRTYPEVYVRVGVRDADVALAEARAVTFAAALVTRGVAADRVAPFWEEGDPGVWMEIVIVP